MIFYLGAHHPRWLELADVPLFVSAAQLRDRRRLPVARCPWALDSGGFSQLSQFGEWTIPASQYAVEVRRFAGEIGHLAWAAPQDWMCEPSMLQRTGRSILAHQQLTIANFQVLRDLAPDLPFVPVLQGWKTDDYERHAEGYAAAGVDLQAEPLVAVGSICRRQGSGEAEAIIRRLARHGLRLHAFGAKILGLARFFDALASADSMAWSYRARRDAPLPGCQHRNCANCWRYARAWHTVVMQRLAQPRQLIFSELW